MARLKTHEFTCPFCNDARITFVSEEKENEIRAREKRMQEIFSPQFFDATYREIFISHICSNCQRGVFGGNEKDLTFDVNENEKTDELEARIMDMYENARE